MNGVGNGNGFDLVQKCPHEGDGAFIVQGDMWKVGQRYELIRVLGKGSFSVVCLAHDKQTKDLVALKKIKDVFVHKNNAKNVIREVYIQRRLRHPNVVELLDLIMMPSPTGKWKLVNGKLVTDSVDLYLVLECADGGDLFQLGEQLDQGEVIHIMKQLLVAVEFLHSCGVIHRDIKTANILIKTMPGTGKKTVKLADFGCARVAASSGAAHKASPGKRMARNRSYEDLPDSPTESEAETLASAMMTTAVATPCYRAPEVVMSLESYTSKVDIWSLGCILAELLARWLSHSKGYCKHTRVLPLFNLSTQPRVLSGVAWDDGDGATMAHRELRTVFEVIGTPAWHLVDKIGDPRWRKFLQCLPGHAPTLMRRFHGVNEVCLDLLRRMLEFDPQSRCGATEALTHEYFAEEGGAEGEDRVTGEFNVLHSKDKEAFDRLESELEALLRDEEDTHALKLKQILDNEIEEHQTCRGEEGWEPVAIASPGLRKLNLGKSAAVLSSYPHTTHTKVQQNEIGEDAHEEITRSYHESQGQGSPRRKKEVSFLDDGRHKDWTTFSSCTQEPHWSRTKEAEPVWGVSTVIPGSTHSASEQQSR